MSVVSPKLHVAIPVLDELEYLPRCVEALRVQESVKPVLWFCVNQPEAWHGDDARRGACEANHACLQLLGRIDDLDVRVLDRSSPGRGWPAGRGGVGQARKELMDAIGSEAAAEDLIVSLDADTVVPRNYLRAVADAFARHPGACALAARYRHPLTSADAVTRAMLGYEIYMRLYVLNLWRIGSPYAFTALGSALALPVHVYRQLGGITPRTSSEDFYFLQRLAKRGRLLHWCDAVVAPATRISERVPVGTGQAILAACRGLHAGRYPLYAAELFDDIGATTAAFAALFAGPQETPLDGFLSLQFRARDPWHALRGNHRNVEGFVRACHERLDGLRILQYLKQGYRRAPTDDTETLRRWLEQHGRELPGTAAQAAQWSDELGRRPLQRLSTAELDRLRLLLCTMEDHYRREDDRRA